MSDREQLHELVGGAFELVDLIEYQPGAVVSRALVDDEAATVTVFAFDESERLSEHTAPHDALLQVLDGTASISVDGEQHEVAAGETIVLPAEVPHAVDAVSQFKMLLTMIR